jgi:serine/threonine protein kinase
MSGTYGTYKTIPETERGIKKMHLFRTLDDDTLVISGPAIREIIFYHNFEHPYIAKCHSLAMTNTHVKLELDGGYCNLHQWSKRSYTLKMKYFEFIFIRLLDALAYMHRSRVLHGDIKPENIVLRRNQCPMFIDFGGAQFANPANGTYPKGLTTFEFVSPEYALSDIYGPSNDMWALGMTMLQYFTGHYQPRFTTLDAVREWYENNDIPAVPLYIPTKFRNIIEHLLVRDHTQRPTAHECLTDFYLINPSTKIDALMLTYNSKFTHCYKIIGAHLRNLWLEDTAISDETKRAIAPLILVKE